MAEQPNIIYGNTGTDFTYMCLRSSSGSLYKLLVDDNGVLTTELVSP